MRLASGKQNGAIITPALDLSGTANLTVTAKQYGSDTGALLTVTVDGDPLGTFTTAAGNQDFTAVISEKTSTSKITFSASSGKRVYIDYVKVATEGATYTIVPVNGYPKEIGNVLSYQVDGLISDSTYYYTVTPQGNVSSVSDAIMVHTPAIANGTNNHTQDPLNWHISNNVLRLKNLPANSRVVVYDSLGKLINSSPSTDSGLSIELPYRGVYLIQVHNNQKISGYKIIN